MTSDLTPVSLAAPHVSSAATETQPTKLWTNEAYYELKDKLDELLQNRGIIEATGEIQWDVRWAWRKKPGV